MPPVSLHNSSKVADQQSVFTAFLLVANGTSYPFGEVRERLLH
jgi:hypothetical protein